MLKDAVREFLRNHWLSRYIIRPLLLIYVVLLLFAVLFSDAIIYQGGQASYQDDAEIIKLTAADGVDISARYLPNPDARYTLLYSHGNGEDLGDDTAMLNRLLGEGFAVFAYDYHGYGTSEGRASERNLYRDIDAAYAYLTGPLQIPPERIILYGRSLGGAPSIDLATRKAVAGLILQSTFISAYQVITQVPLLPFDKFRNIDKVSRVRCPVLVMHGHADSVIPFNHGKRLYRAIRTKKQALWVANADHNDFLDAADSEFHDSLQRFTKALTQ